MRQTVFRRGLSANALKLYAIFAMLLDHIAWAFVPTYSLSGQLMHIVGRTTIPIMCFFLSEGYAHTRSVPRYAGRLALFAALSYLPFIYFETGGLPEGSSCLYLNVLYTLLCCLFALCVWDRVRNAGLKAALLLLLCLVSDLGDWGVYALLFTLSFYANRGDFPRQAFWFFCSALVMFTLMVSQTLADNPALPFSTALSRNAMQLGVLLTLPLLCLYNGNRGKGCKWAFYLFYPLHLLVLGVLRWAVLL